MTPYLADPDFTLYNGDVLEVLRGLPDGSVHTCVTSPPYWGLRDYDVDGQLGLEPTPGAYIARMVAVFREVRRVLRDDGTLWLNIGDSYNGSGLSGGKASIEGTFSFRGKQDAGRINAADCKPKDLVGIPWLLAFALRADGWYLRADIIWSKPNPMPESVTDRPTKAHEYLFLLTKSARYFYDADAIREPAAWERWGDQTVRKPQPGKGSWLRDKTKAELDEIARPRHRKQDELGKRTYTGFNDRWDAKEGDARGRNKRSVWEIATEPYPEAHFATFPTALVEPCVKAGSPVGGTVLDPFSGSGTTALVARKLGRHAVGIELNADYCALAARRLAQQSLLAQEAA